MKILLAEDDANISTIAKITLEKLGGHEVTVVADGEQALIFGLSGQYDLILLDEMMPKLNGLKVSAELFARGNVPPPIIFLSAKSQESDIKEFYQHGTGFIPKPFDPMTLSQQILTILQGAAAA
jgi:two-component system, OmpR family, response regulator